MCPDIYLYLLSEDYPKGPLPHEEMLAIMNTPAYWTFCWASGQVLAAYILDNPDSVSGKTVLDLGAGSGVVAVAAMKAGAAKAIACDIDPQALDASAANAELNGVAIDLLDDLAQAPAGIDLIIAADVLYDRENLPLVDAVRKIAPEIIIGDSRVRDHNVFHEYDLLVEVTATTIPDLDELKEFGEVKIYRSR